MPFSDTNRGTIFDHYERLLVASPLLCLVPLATFLSQSVLVFTEVDLDSKSSYG